MNSFTVTESDLQDLASASAFAAATKTGGILAGVQFKITDDAVSARATDSFVLAQFTRNAIASSGESDVVLSGVSLRAAVKALKTLTGGPGRRGLGEVTVSWEAESPSATNETVTLAPARLAALMKVAPFDSKYFDVSLMCVTHSSWCGAMVISSVDGRTVAVVMPVRVKV